MDAVRRVRPLRFVIEQIKRLVDNGFNEVVLTGVDMTSWGADLPGQPRLGDLVQKILRHVRVWRGFGSAVLIV